MCVSAQASTSDDRITQTNARITSVSDACQYVVKPKGRPVRNITDFVSCSTARRVAEEESDPSGFIRRRTLASIEFETVSAGTVESSVVLNQNRIFFPGDEVQVAYRNDNPVDVQEVVSDPLLGSPQEAALSLFHRIELVIAIIVAILVGCGFAVCARHLLRNLKAGASDTSFRTGSQFGGHSAPPAELTSSGTGFYGPSRNGFGGR